LNSATRFSRRSTDSNWFSLFPSLSAPSRDDVTQLIDLHPVSIDLAVQTTPNLMIDDELFSLFFDLLMADYLLLSRLFFTARFENGSQLLELFVSSNTHSPVVVFRLFVSSVVHEWIRPQNSARPRPPSYATTKGHFNAVPLAFYFGNDHRDFNRFGSEGKVEIKKRKHSTLTHTQRCFLSIE
jgi:hypothetical protein